MTDDYIDIDPDTGEITRGAPLPAIADDVYRPTLVLAPDQAAGLVEQVLELQRSVLRQGVDYDRIPGTPKPTLLKPGAERLLQVFGLGHHMELLNTDTDDSGRPFGFFYRCTITKGLSDGRVITVSSCDGYCGRDESKWKNAPLNTILKMAQKRALVGACLTATATSGLFTQDIEDMDPPQRQSRPSRPAAAPPAEPEDPHAISPQQVKLVNVLMGKAGIDEREEKLGYCAQVLGRAVSSSKDMTKKEASMVIDALKLLVGEE